MKSVRNEVYPIVRWRGDYLPVSQYAVRQMAAQWSDISEDRVVISPWLDVMFRSESLTLCMGIIEQLKQASLPV